mmetsp:Transcript_41725/g.65154  ORF Transcript_41725/g.65154 Transcript_41725/m.65154 type:complete len:130 (-) Transcript_41725:115-504(-)
MIRQSINTNSRTLQVHITVFAINQQTRAQAIATLTYTDVPSYYSCDNDQISNLAKKRDCFKCCRSACVVDEFAQGGKKAGFTYQYCDKSCYQFCGYISTGRLAKIGAVKRLRRRLLQWFRERRDRRRRR